VSFVSSPHSYTEFFTNPDFCGEYFFAHSQAIASGATANPTAAIIRITTGRYVSTNTEFINTHGCWLQDPKSAAGNQSLAQVHLATAYASARLLTPSKSHTNPLKCLPMPEISDERNAIFSIEKSGIEPSICDTQPEFCDAAHTARRATLSET
jgi:hypothetical protein